MKEENNIPKFIMLHVFLPIAACCPSPLLVCGAIVLCSSMQALHVAFDADSKDVTVILNDGVFGVPFVCKDFGIIDERLRHLQV